MVPSVAVPLPQPIQQVMDSVTAVGAPTEVSATRIPYRAVPATISPQESYNNTRSSASIPKNADQTPAAEIIEQVETSPTPKVPGLSQSDGFSTLFMTQALGQSDSGVDQLVENFYQNDVEFEPPGAFVKHLPSYASLPEPQPDGNAKLSEPVDVRPADAKPVSRQKASSIVINIPEVAIPEKAAEKLEETSLPVQEQASGPQAPRPELDAVTEILNERSLVRPQGAEAYEATATRNDENAVAEARAEARAQVQQQPESEAS